MSMPPCVHVSRFMPSCLYVSIFMSPCPHITISPCFLVSMSPCPHVSMSQCLHVSMSPCLYVSTSLCLHVSMAPKYSSSGISFGIQCIFTPEFRGILHMEFRRFPRKLKLIPKKIPTSAEFQKSASVKT